jgi:hypothetical protein
MTTHWKKLTNPNYIGSYSLQPDEKRIVQIESVAKQMVNGPDGKQEECIVASLKGEKPFILNKTNCKAIAKVAKSPYIEDWAGIKIRIYTEKVRAFGETVDALRVEPKPVQLPVMDKSHPKYDQAKAALVAGQITIEQLKKNYNINEKDF